MKKLPIREINLEKSKIFVALSLDSHDREVLSDIFAQIERQGRVFAQDVRQLTSMGFPFIKEMATTLNKNASNIIAEIETGNITSANFFKMIERVTSEGGIFA